MVQQRPSTARNRRRREIHDARYAAAQALVDADAAISPDDRLVALEQCRDTLYELLRVTMTDKQLVALREEFPDLVQPSLFFRSSSE